MTLCRAVTGDFEILTKVLHHLIRNAIEYCGAAFSARSHFIQTGGFRLGILRRGQRSRYRPRIPRPHLRSV